MRQRAAMLAAFVYSKGVVINQYITSALRRAHYEVLENSEGFYGSIPSLTGVWAQAATLEDCREELKSALEDWLLFQSVEAAADPGDRRHRLSDPRSRVSNKLGPVKRRDLIARLRRLISMGPLPVESINFWSAAPCG